MDRKCFVGPWGFALVYPSCQYPGKAVVESRFPTHSDSVVSAQHVNLTLPTIVLIRR